MSGIKEELGDLFKVFGRLPFGGGGSFWRWLGSSQLFFIIAPLILVACVIGSVIPQGADIRILESRWGDWPLAVILTMGLNQVFYTWWFLLFLGVFGLNLVVCSIRRGFSLHWGVWTTHMGLIIIMVGGIVTGVWGEKTRIRLVQDHPSDEAFVGASPYKLPFKILLKRFEIQNYGGEDQHEVLCVEGGVESTIFIDPDSTETVSVGKDLTVRLKKFLPHFVIGDDNQPTNRSNEPNNPAILLEVTHGVHQHEVWVFQNFPLFYKKHGGIMDIPDFYYRYNPPRVKQYISDLEIREDGKTVKKGTISVNTPLSWRGYTLFQSSFDPEDSHVSILQVNKDPGVIIVYTGFIVLPIGLFWVLLRKEEGEDERRNLA